MLSTRTLNSNPKLSTKHLPKFDPKTELARVPHEPGVYRYFNEKDEVIYVGKAKDLRNRVGSYFAKTNQHDRKTKRLVSQIRRLEFTIVPTEWDALLLENQLIKRFQPKYNILLRDDKTYPLHLYHPRALPARDYRPPVDRRLGTYFGPFANSRAMYALLDMFKELYTIRSCHLNLTPENIEAGKFKVCLEFHLGNCKGPCEGPPADGRLRRRNRAGQPHPERQPDRAAAVL